jgi:hypothetical protein
MLPTPLRGRHVGRFNYSKAFSFDESEDSTFSVTDWARQHAFAILSAVGGVVIHLSVECFANAVKDKTMALSRAAPPWLGTA